VLLQKHEALALHHSRQSSHRLAAFEETLSEAGETETGRVQLCCYLDIAGRLWIILKNENSQLPLNAPTATRDSLQPHYRDDS